MSKGLQQELSAQGLSCWLAPQIATSPQTIDLLTAVDRSLTQDNRQAWLFISRTAVREFFQQLSANSLTFEPKGQVICVGPGTKKTFLELNPDFSAEILMPEESNSESVVKMPLLNSKVISKLNIIKGKGGRDHIQQHCMENGIAVSEHDVYQRQAISYSKNELEPWLSSRYWLATSTDIARSLLDNLHRNYTEQSTQILQQIHWIVFSDRIKSFCIQQQVPESKIFVCDQQDNSTIIKHIKFSAF